MDKRIVFAIQQLIRAGCWLFALSALTYGLGILMSTIVEAEERLPTVLRSPRVLEFIQAAAVWLRWGGYIIFGLGAISFSVIVVLCGTVVLTWMFFPILFRSRRSRTDWIQSIVALPSVIVCTIVFAELKLFAQLIASLRTWKESHNSSILVRLALPSPDWLVYFGAALTATLFLLLLVICLFSLLDGVYSVITRFAGVVEKIATKSCELISKAIFPKPVAYPQFNTRQADINSSKQSLVMVLMGFPVLFALISVYFFVHGDGADWTAIGLALAGAIVALNAINTVLNEDKIINRFAVLPCLMLAVLVGMLIFVPPTLELKTGEVLPKATETWSAALRLMCRDISLAICFTLVLRHLLTKSFSRSDEGKFGWSKEMEDRANDRLWWAVSGYFGFKLIVIIVCVGICGLTPAYSFRKTDLDKLSADIKPNTDPQKLFRVSAGDYAFMAWAGEVLQSDEFLLARWNEMRAIPEGTDHAEPIGRGQVDTFKAIAEPYRSYYNVRFATLVIIQVVLGWHFGITLICYLLFAFALFAFRYPIPPDGVGAEQYISDRRRSGIIDRVREASNAIITLGFIGTLLGLSQAIFFLGAADPLNELLGRSSISSRLAGSLGLGFFTTFISMVLRLVLNFRYSQWAGENLAYQKQLQMLAEQG